MTENYQEAAYRMFEDAETLTKNGRLGTPDHLYGLAAECALKAVLVAVGVMSIPMTQQQRVIYKVHADQIWCEYSTAISGRTALSVNPTNPFSGWNVSHRYESDATFDSARLRVHRDGAREAMRVLESAETSGVIS